ncbi:MAG: NAD(P)-dependent oxidoreductase [Candidatus Melainabacteria bacterium]|nr:NAD(P)-dependent oxidoreductase [Candidatus Melainabacteria bacterium]
MKVLITGARGFVGRHCLPLLKNPAIEVHATTSAAFPDCEEGVFWHRIDLLDADQVRTLVSSVRPSHLLHLAWYTEHGLYWSDPVNQAWVDASLELVDSFRRSGGERAVLIGTCAEYEWNNSICDEDDPVNPATVYGKAKGELWSKVAQLASSPRLSVAWARLFFVFGPHEDRRRLIPSVVNALISGEPALCGSGELIRDFLYVEDAAGALVKLLDSDFQGVVNISSGSPLSIKDLVNAIADHLNARDLVRLGALESRPGDPLILVGKSKRLHEAVGYVPKYTMDAGLARTIEWWTKERAK